MQNLDFLVFKFPMKIERFLLGSMYEFSHIRINFGKLIQYFCMWDYVNKTNNDRKSIKRLTNTSMQSQNNENISQAINCLKIKTVKNVNTVNRNH